MAPFRKGPIASEPADLVFEGDDSGPPQGPGASGAGERATLSMIGVGSRPFGGVLPWRHNSPWGDSGEPSATTSLADDGPSYLNRGDPYVVPVPPDPTGAEAPLPLRPPLTKTQRRDVERLRKAKEQLEKFIKEMEDRIAEMFPPKPPWAAGVTAVGGGTGFSRRQRQDAIDKAKALIRRMKVVIAKPPKGRPPQGAKFFPPLMVIAAENHIAESKPMLD